MIELKKKVNISLNKVNALWTQAIKEGTKSEEGIDLTEMPQKITEIITELDQAFMEASQRTNKKGGLFR